ncbi:hypothetical protein JB92DRAFT_3024526 [Gautieria morchelliformis]|nr:hypothetical protein JB92DRAFT_3024526 [Gautieria morchelliformis]
MVGKKPSVCGTRLEQLELECLMALHALRLSDSESNHDAGKTLGAPHWNRTFKAAGLQSQYSLTKENYKNELWNQDFEPVLHRIRVAIAATTNAESAKSEAVHRLVTSNAMIQKENDVLNGLLGECVRMKNILGNVRLFLGTSSVAGERCGSWCDNIHGPCEGTDTMEAMSQELAATSLGGTEPTSQPNSTREEDIDFRAYCGDPLSLPILRAQANGETSTTRQTDTTPAPSTVFSPLMTTQLYAAVTKYIPVTQIEAENTALASLLDQEREDFNATHAAVQRRNEENLSLAADLLVEAVELQAETQRVRAVTKVDIRVSVKFREEAERRRNAVTSAQV